MRSWVAPISVLMVFCAAVALVPGDGSAQAPPQQPAPAQQATPAEDAARAARRERLVARRDRSLAQAAAVSPPAAPNGVCACAGEQGSTVSAAPSFAELGSRLNGRYAASGDEKDDSAQTLRPPMNPGGEAIGWINRHNAGLRSIIDEVFSDVDMNAFGRAEQAACGNNVYCRMTYREQAIALIVGN